MLAAPGRDSAPKPRGSVASLEARPDPEYAAPSRDSAPKPHATVAAGDIAICSKKTRNKA
ncbi:hypothetical protein MoryE10_31800 [Methylogaea oryzae]|uniref:Uncharacterized protein n=1 Tax=Methylogaea oryzae TaxID=1295382 RepID=A0A8D4VU62_9GAMM|nr:hypothetical protein MoryE10_31800 [Methylogaea oryzae]